MWPSAGPFPATPQQPWGRGGSPAQAKRGVHPPSPPSQLQRPAHGVSPASAAGQEDRQRPASVSSVGGVLSGVSAEEERPWPAARVRVLIAALTSAVWEPSAPQNNNNNNKKKYAARL